MRGVLKSVDPWIENSLNPASSETMTMMFGAGTDDANSGDAATKELNKKADFMPGFMVMANRWVNAVKAKDMAERAVRRMGRGN